jgi:transposase InsO family protein
LPWETLGGARYFAAFADDYTRYSEVGIKKVKSDKGGDYVNKELKEFYAGAGTIHQRTPPYTHQHNGVAERLNRSLLEKERAVRIAANLPKITYGESLAMANYLRNISPASGQEQA